MANLVQPTHPRMNPGQNPIINCIHSCRIVELPKISDPRGNLTFIEEDRHIPFPIRRVYYLYDVPGGAERGGHAHKNLHQLVIALSGSFDILLDDGRETVRHQLNRPYLGLHLCPMVWRDIGNFSSGAVCLVLASEYFNADDYIRDYPAFLSAAQSHQASLLLPHGLSKTGQ